MISYLSQLVSPSISMSSPATAPSLKSVVVVSSAMILIFLPFWDYRGILRLPGQCSSVLGISLGESVLELLFALL